MTYPVKFTATKNPDWFRIQWNLSNVCNYSCSYCPAHLHDGSIPRLPRDVVLSFCEFLVNEIQIKRNKKIGILFTGGEVTQVPYFPEILKYLSDNNCHITVHTNGSRTLNYWKRVAPYINQMSISVHHESCDYTHLENLNTLVQEYDIANDYLFCIPPENFDAMWEKAYYFVNNVTPCVYIKPLRKDFGPEWYDYTDEQWDLIKNTDFEYAGSMPPPRGTWSTSMKHDVLWSTGETTVKTSSEIQNANLHHWKGWYCNIGKEQLIIDFDGNVYGGQCKVGGTLFNVYDNFKVIPDQPTICTQNTCDCRADMLIKKYRGN